jgi:hypothetical protein
VPLGSKLNRFIELSAWQLCNLCRLGNPNEIVLEKPQCPTCSSKRGPNFVGTRLSNERSWMMKKSSIDERQQETCLKHGTTWYPAPANLKVGVARNVKSSIVPINGLRHAPEGDTTGWYMWAGEGDPSTDPDYLVPLHVEHLTQ